METEKKPRAISEIAGEIFRDWIKAGKVSPYAKPYLDAMTALDSIGDMYGCDSAKSIVLYFLANASSYRGETARKLKAELKAIAGVK